MKIAILFFAFAFLAIARGNETNDYDGENSLTFNFLLNFMFLTINLIFDKKS